MPTQLDDNPIDERTDQGVYRGHDDLSDVSAAERAEADRLGASLENPDDVAGAEKNPNAMNYTGNNASPPKASKGRTSKAGMFFKKKGSIIGIISILGIGGVGVGIFGPGSLLTAVMQNLTGVNDSTSRVMNTRAKAVLNRLIKDPGDDGGICSSAKKTIKCRGSRISNKALKNLKKRGIIAGTGTGSNFKPIEIGKMGYPKGGNPTSYQIDLGDGKGPRTIQAKDLRGFLTANPKIGAKVFGRVGIFNMRTKAITGKAMKKFRDKFSLKRDGGIANGQNKKDGSRNEKLNEAKKNFRDSSSNNNTDGVKDEVKKRANAKIASAKIGGAAYATAYLGCLATKGPSLIAGGVAAIQLARIMPLAMHFLLSPGAKLTASGVDKENAVTPEDIDIAGAVLTNKTKDDDGKMKSALGSPLLLSAMGINTNKVDAKTYGDYIPGYNILTAPGFATARDIQKGAAPACAVIMSPITMYAALGVSVAIAAGTAGIGGLANIAGSFVVTWAAGPLIDWLVGAGLDAALNHLAGKDILGSLEGIQFGHALGGSAIAMFAAMGMARNLPTVPVSKLSSFKQVVDKEIALEREYDIASLSPFDTSSPHTFLGSMVHSLRINAIANGGYNGGVASFIGNLARIPFAALTPKTTLASEGFNTSMCDYADTFDLAPEDGPVPATNIMALPCTGFTDEQASMSPETAENILIQKGWLDAEKDVAEDATIDDLIAAGVIKKDTPMITYIESCSDASTGDYVFEGAGCTIPDQVTAGVAEGNPGDLGCGTNDEGKKDCSERNEISTPSRSNTGEDDTEAYLAMSVWLIDFQVAQSINGEDDEEGGGDSTVSGEFSHPLKDDYGYDMYDNPPTDHIQGATDWWRPTGTPVYAIHSGTVTSFKYDTTYSGQMGINHGEFSANYTHIGPNPPVNIGDTVKAGQQIGVVGPAPAQSPTIPHLHLGISKDPNNPWNYDQYYQSAKFLRDNGIDPGPCGGAAAPALIGLGPNGTGACHYAG